jgi:hypothetical protein
MEVQKFKKNFLSIHMDAESLFAFLANKENQ